MMGAMKTFEHDGVAFEVAYCCLCESDMIRCPTCRNNTCNGGYGEVNGEQCLDCEAAYEASYAMWAKEAA